MSARHRAGFSIRGAWVWTLLAGLLAAGTSLAAEPKSYASVFLQGRISDGPPGRPLVGATVRLTGPERAFESVTDARGAFTFERLPLTSFTLEIETADGAVLRGLRELDPTDPEQRRAQIVLGPPRAKTSPEQVVVVPLEDTRLSLAAPAEARDWRRLRRQGLWFLAGVLLLAL